MKETVFVRMMRWAKAKGWNQSKVASELGLPAAQNVSNWKTRGVPPEWHAPIARLFGRSVDELIGETQEGPAIAARKWPFPKIDESKVYAMKGDDAVALERAFIVAAANVGLDIKKP